MDDTRTAVPALTALAERTGVEEHRLAMLGTLLALPVASAIIALFV
jgi:hypothetical protein